MLVSFDTNPIVYHRHLKQSVWCLVHILMMLQISQLEFIFDHLTNYFYIATLLRELQGI